MDKYQKLVGIAVAEIRNPSETGISRSFEALSVIPVDDLLAELGVWVEEITNGKDVRRLIATAELPLPENPEELVEIINRNDLKGLYSYVNGDFAKLIASMMMLIASLQEASERVT